MFNYSGVNTGEIILQISVLLSVYEKNYSTNVFLLTIHLLFPWRDHRDVVNLVFK